VFFLARINRYRLFLFNYPKGTFKFAIKGYFGGLAQLLRTLKKRKIVQAGNIVSSEYLEKLF
jgi:hypothetical protein